MAGHKKSPPVGAGLFDAKMATLFLLVGFFGLLAMAGMTVLFAGAGAAGGAVTGAATVLGGAGIGVLAGACVGEPGEGEEGEDEGGFELHGFWDSEVLREYWKPHTVRGKDADSTR